MLLVEELVNDNPYGLPDEFLELLPQKCLNPLCGSPTEISEVLTGLRCSNPRCPTKITMRLLALVNSLGILNVGKSKAEGFLRKFGVDNPALVFAYEYDEDGGFDDKTGESVSRQIEADIRDKCTFTLAEYVKVCQLPNIQESATAIFDGYNSLEEAYNDIESGGVDFIRKRLGIKKGASITEKVINEKAEGMYKYLCSVKGNDSLVEVYIDEEELGVFKGYSVSEIYDCIQSGGIDFIKSRIRAIFETRPDLDVSVRALKVYKSLMLFKKDLFDALPFVKIINPNREEGLRMLTVVCSTAVGEPFNSKPDFYSYINNNFSDVVHVNFVKSFSRKVDYTVWSGGSTFNPEARITNKVTATLDNNEVFNQRVNAGEQVDVDGRLSDGMHYIPILDAREFIEMIKSLR